MLFVCLCCSGYDSAGVGFIRGGEAQIAVIKKAGKVANLRSATETQDCRANIGIAHTRWATHGPPDDKNAHPHFSTDKTVAVVHNGIIENYRELQTMLERLHGYRFSSQTDTELLAHLAHFVRVSHLCFVRLKPNAFSSSVSCWAVGFPLTQTRQQHPELSLTNVIRRVLAQVEGAYGVCFMFADHPNVLIGARKGSPLILGIGKVRDAESKADDGSPSTGKVEECFFASDASAIIEYTNKVRSVEVCLLALHDTLAFPWPGRVHRRKRHLHNHTCGLGRGVLQH